MPKSHSCCCLREPGLDPGTAVPNPEGRTAQLCGSRASGP